MAKQKPAQSSKPTRKQEGSPGAKVPPVSELASLVMGCKQDAQTLPILADFLEENLHLGALATLLRAPDYAVLKNQITSPSGFTYRRLARDVFVWVVDARYPEKRNWKGTPCLVLGLYAHPEGTRARWAKVTGMIPLEDSETPHPEHSWLKLPKKDSRIEEARTELQAFTFQADETSG
jgi:hypothetical protein